MDLDEGDPAGKSARPTPMRVQTEPALSVDGGEVAKVVNTPQGRHVRLPTLYDAVAGLIRSRVPRTADGSMARRLFLTPDEAVYRARRAPLRFAETDTYFADEDLATNGRDDGDGDGNGTHTLLPDSDLLTAVHRYASAFYERLSLEGGGDEPSTARPLDGRSLNERSLDETALLAFGILLEEAGRGVLGARGDLVFTEGAGSDDSAWETEEDEDGSDSSSDGNSDDSSDGDIDEDGDDHPDCQDATTTG